MDKIEGLYGVLIDQYLTTFVEGPWDYEEAVNQYHIYVEHYAHTEIKVRLVKISFLG